MIRSIRTDLLSAAMNGQIAFSEASPDSLQILAPFYHEDGDMYDIFLQDVNGKLQICDFGMTLMRLSYKTDLDTDRKYKIFSKIVSNHCVENNGGNLTMNTSYETFFTDLMQFQIAISKVLNIEILTRESIASLFWEQFSAFISHDLSSKYKKVQAHYRPTNESGYEADYAILDRAEKPVFILAVKDSLSALRATSLCLRVKTERMNYSSIAVFDASAVIAKRDADALTNVIDKQYTNLDEFKGHVEEYIDRQIA